MRRGSAHLLILLLISAGIFAVAYFHYSQKSIPFVQEIVFRGTPVPEEDKPFGTYTLPKIESKQAYTIFLFGDSMTYALGPHGGTFNGFINELYKESKRGFFIDNYARGSTNVLSWNEAMTTETIYWDSKFEPLLSRDFDLILIESFGYNPLSNLPPEEGAKAQTEALDEMMKTLTSTHPNSAIVFVATIAPSKTSYAKKALPELTETERTLQAEDRIFYIKNHMNYAKVHKIPLINIFEKSLSEQEDGDLRYINPDDYIHPSFEGVDFIGHEIANFIWENQILPK